MPTLAPTTAKGVASAGSVAIVSAVALLAVAACGSTTASPSQSPSAGQAGTAATQPSAPANQSSTLPGPPAGSTQVASQAGGGASYSQYKTGTSPTAVIAYYNAAFKSAGLNVTSSGGGGDGWGQYGGSGAGTEANNGTTFVAVNAGGSKQGATYFEVCAGSSAAQVDNCQSQHHSSSSGS